MNKKKIVSIILSIALIITMLPESVSKAADNSVVITEFNGDVNFYDSYGVNLHPKDHRMELLMHYNNTKNGVCLFRDEDLTKIRELLNGGNLCIRSIDVEIDVTGEVASNFNPYIHVFFNGTTKWKYGDGTSNRVGCTENVPTVAKAGTYKITLTIDDALKDCSAEFLDKTNAILAVSTEEKDAATNNPDTKISLRSVTINTEVANVADLTTFNTAREQAEKIQAGKTIVKTQSKYNYYPESVRNAVLAALNKTNSIKNTNTQEEVDTATQSLNDAMKDAISVKGLWDACNTALQDKEKADYTAESWAVLETAINNALGLSDEGISSVKVADLTKKVNDAAEALQKKSDVPVEDPLITKLKETINPYRNWKEESYTPETWKDYKDARDAIQAVIDNPPEDLNEETVDALITTFKTAVGAIKYADLDEAKAELQKVVDKYKDYKEADYTAKSWQEFADALSRAQGYLTAGAGQTVVSVLKDAGKALEEAAAALVEAEPKEPGVYLDYSGSWIKQGKNNEMEGYVADGSQAKFSVQEYWTDVTGVDLSGLDYPVLEVDYVANSDTLQVVYNTTGTSGWNDANPVITSGSENSGKYKISLADKKDMKYLFVGSNGSSLELKRIKIYDDPLGAVTEAKKALDDAVTSAGKLKKADYTAETWAVLEKALADAKKITDSSTVEEINAAKKALDDAVKGLKKAAPSPSPSSQVTGQPTAKPDDTSKPQESAKPTTKPTTKPTAKPPVKTAEPLGKGVKVVTGKLVYKVTKAATAKAPGTLTVTALSAAGKKAGSLSIPATATIKGHKYKVTKLGNNVFKGAKAKSVALGKNITAIPKGAFANCKKLSALTVKAKLKSVKKGAFKGCKKTIKVKGSTKKNRKANVKKLKKSGYKKFK